MDKSQRPDRPHGPADRPVLVVGAGFAGAVHARELAERGYRVQVIDSRPHVGGNCFDELDPCGVRFHRYGPHLFHTSNAAVVAWLSRFTEWTPYEHRVVARLGSGRLVPMPVNLDTVNAVFGTRLSNREEAEAFLSSAAERRPVIRSAEDELFARIGPELTNLFYRPYTRKMWGLDLSEMDAAVVRRLRIRTDREDRYFPDDAFQALPRDGYAALFGKMLDHPNISVSVGQEYHPAMLGDCLHCFNSMPIDAFFDFRLGELPYRSIRFHHARRPVAEAPGAVTVNATDDGPLTRETWWHALPGHHVRDTGTVLRTAEEPCDYRDNGHERYYPVKTHDGRHDALYRAYAELARGDPRISFIGRCGTYQYLDMHQVVNQSLMSARRWADAELARAS